MPARHLRRANNKCLSPYKIMLLLLLSLFLHDNESLKHIYTLSTVTTQGYMSITTHGPSCWRAPVICGHAGVRPHRSQVYLYLQLEFLPHPRVKVSIVGSLRDREVACSASDGQGLNFESCVWRTVSSQSSHHPQEVLQAQFSLYVHKGALKPDSFHFVFFEYTSCTPG